MDAGNNVFADRKIRDIDPSRHSKVRILGTVVGKVDRSIFVDDGTGTVQVTALYDDFSGVGENQMVRVFGRVRSSSDDFDILAEIIQDMSKLNLKLYNRVQQYYEKMLDTI